MLGNYRLYPPRPRSWGRGQAEPSLGWPIRLAVRLLSARGIGTPLLRSRLELSGLTWPEIAPILARIRTLDQWARIWRQQAYHSHEQGDDRRAAAQAFLAQLILSPFHPQKRILLDFSRACQVRERQTRCDSTLQHLFLGGKRLAGFWEVPKKQTGLPVVLLPPLASTKEELWVLADPLLAAGHAVLRLDLPGQGESAPPLSLTAEDEILQALEQLGKDEFIVGGISLGAYYALRVAGAAPRRARGVVCISPPAVVTPAQWARQPEVIWQYLDLYFQAASRVQTYRQAIAMDLSARAAQIRCPALIFQGLYDRISLPDAPQRYQKLLKHVPLTLRLLADRHACPTYLQGEIAREIVHWCAERTEPPGQEIFYQATNTTALAISAGQGEEDWQQQDDDR